MQPVNKLPRKTPKREKTTLSSSSESEKNSDPVHVYCRLRPLEDGEETCVKLLSTSLLCLSSPVDNKILRKDIEYVYRHIFTAPSTQKEVFDHVAYPLLEDVIKGKNGLLFTYGVTGSGKTYTLTGDQNNPGILPRCIDTLFNSIGDLQAKKFIIKSDRLNGFEVQTEEDAERDRVSELRSASRTIKPLKKTGSEIKLYSNDGVKIVGINESNLYAVFISYIEIYNNTVFDLLEETGGKNLQSKIVREDSQKNMYVNGITEIEAKSSLDAYELFSAGQKRKRMGHTILNAKSSRSHSIFNIRVVQLEQEVFNKLGEPMVPERNLLKVGRLSLVDLAGSERCSRTNNTGMRLKEASGINNSLMSLRTCMEILRDNQLNNANRLVPYRDSRLTLLFKNYFEGEGRIHMVVCVNPAVQDYEENIQVMKFAEMSQDVRVARAEVRFTPHHKSQESAKKFPCQTPISSKVKSTPSVFGPQMPAIKINFEDHEGCESTILRVIRILKTRKEKSRTYAKELANREHGFRKRLTEIDQANALSRVEVRGLKALFHKEKSKSQNLEAKIADLETANDDLACKTEEQRDVIKTLKHVIDEKDVKINHNFLATERSKQKMQLHKEKLNQEVDDQLRRQREQLRAEMHAKDMKLQKVKQILESKNEDVSVPQTPTAAAARENKFHPQTCPGGVGGGAESAAAKKCRAVTKTGSRRRSRSVGGEVWLEHNAVKPVPLGTVMQPTMKKRKSVTKLSKAADITNPKQSKYCLIAQEPDVDGEMETKLYKADIVPTCGGGAQVIFNDVERLRQESPTRSPVK